MSAALLKKSLELCDTPFLVKSDNQHLHYKGLSDKSKPKKTQRGISDVERKNITCIEQVKKKREHQKRKENEINEKLQKLKRPVIDGRLAKTILEATKKRGASAREITYNYKRPKEEKSVFTEEDFERFEREYADDS